MGLKLNSKLSVQIGQTTQWKCESATYPSIPPPPPNWVAMAMSNLLSLFMLFTPTCDTEVVHLQYQLLNLYFSFPINATLTFTTSVSSWPDVSFNSVLQLVQREDEVFYDVVAIVDPLTRDAQKLAPLLAVRTTLVTSKSLLFLKHVCAVIQLRDVCFRFLI